MDREDAKAADQNPLPRDFDDLELSEWGLDWGDISLIRDKLALTPAERLEAAQRSVRTLFELRHAKRRA